MCQTLSHLLECRAHIHSACFPNFDTVAQTTSAGAESTIDILADTGAYPMPTGCPVVDDALTEGLSLQAKKAVHLIYMELGCTDGMTFHRLHCNKEDAHHCNRQPCPSFGPC